MPFTVGVEDAKHFDAFMVNVIVTSFTVAWVMLLFFRSLNWNLVRHRKPFSIAMTSTLFFVTLRNITTMLIYSGLPVPCRLVAIIGAILYQLFAISAEWALLIRCRSFTRYPKMVTNLTIPTWLIRLGLCLWLVTTMKAEDSVSGYRCDVSMDYSLSAAMQYVKIATEAIILVFFLERVIAMHRDSMGAQVDAHHDHWRRLALINSTITFFVIMFEVLVGQITIYQKDYLFLAYAVVNLIQATLVVFIVDDTKKIFRARAAQIQKENKEGRASFSHNTNGSHHTHGGIRGSTAAEGHYHHQDTDFIGYHTNSKQSVDGQVNPINLGGGGGGPWSVSLRTPPSPALTLPHPPVHFHHSSQSIGAGESSGNMHHYQRYQQQQQSPVRTFPPLDRPLGKYYDFGALPVDQQSSVLAAPAASASIKGFAASSWAMDTEPADWRSATRQQEEDQIPMTLPTKLKGEHEEV